ncbi:trypco2 family protein [Tabrizicola aquatica]|uniref:trypco2 family protein n=1 Tax=Tabrizicola aquatica TaxID=909926 RepID=UPI000CD28031|nr:trypco2 family protein [Tabrizicola aquatica]
MDLKDFIKETVKAITEAAHELKSELADVGAIVNPPTNGSRADTYKSAGAGDILRRVQNIEFDVALTTTSSVAAGGKAGLKIFVVEASGDAAHTKANEEVSRIKFSIPIALPPSDEEAMNRQLYDDRMARD